MLCCLDSPFSDSREAYNRQAYDNGSSFPGNRRFVKTGGNALAAAPSSQSRQTGDGTSMMAVAVPEGISGGQQIQVAAPDGRMIMATVPGNVRAGSQFMVQLPPVDVQGQRQPEETVDYGGLVPVSPPQSSSYVTPSEPFAPAVPVHAAPGATTIQPSSVVASPTPIHATPVVPVPPPPPPVTQTMMKVQVPPGTAPGSTIHVQVPNESRVLAVQVPQGVSEFHVAYEPTISQTATSPVIAPSVVPVPPPNNNERRLLVRVTPGTAPGTTLHVTVPDEPGRVIAAKVPPGNVSEFYVSYQPASSSMMNGRATTGGVVSQNSARNNTARNPNNSNNNSSGMGNVFLPLLGGAALGAAGMSMFNHGRASDTYDNNGEYYGNTVDEADQGDYGQQADEYSDYGAADGGAFGDDGGGGGFDFGGGDFGGFDF